MEGSAQQPAPDRDRGRTTKATPNKRAKGHTDREGPRHREAGPEQRQPKNTNGHGHREKDNEYTESGNPRNQYNDRAALQYATAQHYTGVGIKRFTIVQATPQQNQTHGIKWNTEHTARAPVGK